MLEFNQYLKSDKAPFIIYAAPQCLIEKCDRCNNIPKHSSTAKLGEHIPSGFSMPTISSFENIEPSRYMCLEIYELDPARFLTAPGLGWQAALKKTESKSVRISELHENVFDVKQVFNNADECESSDLANFFSLKRKYEKRYSTPPRSAH